MEKIKEEFIEAVNKKVQLIKKSGNKYDANDVFFIQLSAYEVFKGIDQIEKVARKNEL